MLVGWIRSLRRDAMAEAGEEGVLRIGRRCYVSNLACELAARLYRDEEGLLGPLEAELGPWKTQVWTDQRGHPA